MPTTPRNSDGDHDHEIRVIRFHAAMVPPPSGFRVNIFLPAVTVLPVGARARLRTKKKIRRGMKKIVIIKKKIKNYTIHFFCTCAYFRGQKKKRPTCVESKKKPVLNLARKMDALWILFFTALGFNIADLSAAQKFPAWLGPEDFTAGTIASPRYGHGFVSSDNILYTFGGFSKGR